MKPHERWIDALISCSRRYRCGEGWRYPGHDLTTGKVHESDCTCGKCEQWRKADALHNEYRLSEGLPV